MDGISCAQDSTTCVQAVCITDPVLATQVLQSKVVDKLRFPYSFLDPVSALSRGHAGRPSTAKPCCTSDHLLCLIAVFVPQQACMASTSIRDMNMEHAMLRYMPGCVTICMHVSW